MTPVFADTSYFVAFVSPSDQNYQRAVDWSAKLRAPIVTTEYVLVEVGNMLRRGTDRELYVNFYRELSADPIVEVLPASSELLVRGLRLFADRPDKEWSLTDCISFAVMSERGLTEALTGDRDFEQAGFRALLRFDPGHA